MRDLILSSICCNHLSHGYCCQRRYNYCYYVFLVTYLSLTSFILQRRSTAAQERQRKRQKLGGWSGESKNSGRQLMDEYLFCIEKQKIMPENEVRASSGIALKIKRNVFHNLSVRILWKLLGRRYYKSHILIYFILQHQRK